MRTLTNLFALLVASPGLVLGDVVVVVGRGPAAAGPVSISDDFNRANGSVGANWTSAGAGTWDINSNRLRANNGSFTDHVLIHVTTLTGANGNIRVTRHDDGSFPRLVFRYTNSSSPHYAIEFNNSNMGWYRYASVGGSSAQIGSNFGTGVSIGGALAITWTGTGTGTEIRIWTDTSGAKTSGGDTSWNGDSTPNHTWTDDPSSAVNTGSGVGVGGSQGTGNTLLLDDFSASDNSA